MFSTYAYHGGRGVSPLDFNIIAWRDIFSEVVLKLIKVDEKDKKQKNGMCSRRGKVMREALIIPSFEQPPVGEYEYLSVRIQFKQ